MWFTLQNGTGALQTIIPCEKIGFFKQGIPSQIINILIGIDIMGNGL